MSEFERNMEAHRRFFALPTSVHRDGFLTHPGRRPLSDRGMRGDDLLMAQDSRGYLWMMTTDGEARWCEQLEAYDSE